MPRLRYTAAAVLALIIALALHGCADGASIEFIPDGGNYTLEEAGELARNVDISPVKDVAPADILDTRQTFLTDLRGFGEDAGTVADVLTRDFPVDTLAVPMRVEAATVDGQTVWLIIEAWAEDGQPLAHRRLWLLERETLVLLDSMSFR